MAKFKVGDKVVPSDTKKWKDKSQYKIIDRVENKYDWNTYYIKGYPAHWYDEELELFEGVEEMKELTFKEVIANIKEGQVWDDGFLKIEMISNSISIGSLNGKPFENIIGFAINPCRKFKLQRKEYTFEEAFKAYEEGKEIEDYKCVKYKKIDGVDHYKMEFEEDFSRRVSEDDYWFSFKEIRGKWYIND